MNRNSQKFALVALMLLVPGGAFAQDEEKEKEPTGPVELYNLSELNVGESGPWSGKEAKIKLSPGEKGKLKFKLGELPEHRFLKLDLDLQLRVGDFSTIIMQGMQGAGKPDKEAKERLQIKAADGRVLLDSSFSSNHLGQSFPDAFGGFSHAPGTGSEKPKGGGNNNGLQGIQMLGMGGGSSGIYKLSILFPHDADSVALDFNWAKPKLEGAGMGMIVQMAGGMFGGDNSPYTITGMKLSAIMEAPADPMDEATAGALLDAIAGDRPVAAHKALQKIVAAGDAALPFIRTRLEIKPDPELEKKFDLAVAKLQSKVFRERAGAEAELIELGVDALPLVITALDADGEDKLGPEIRVGLEKVRKKLQEGAEASSEQALANRLRHALGLSKTDAAKKLLAQLPPMKKLTPYVAPDKPKGMDGFEFNIEGFEGIEELVPVPEKK